MGSLYGKLNLSQLCALFPLLLVLVSCNAKPGNQDSVVEKAPVYSDNAATSTVGAIKSTPSQVLFTANLKTGEMASFQRQLLHSEQRRQSILPQDYQAGELLQMPAEQTKRGASAQQTIRELLNEFGQGKSIDRLCSLSARQLVPAMFGAYQKELASIKAIRFLKNFRMDENQAAFDILLLCQNSSARLQFYLRTKPGTAEWIISDIQGDSSTLSQAKESGYTEYVPTENERQLILEGHIK